MLSERTDFKFSITSKALVFAKWDGDFEPEDLLISFFRQLNSNNFY